MDFISNSIEDTYLIADNIAKKCVGGEVFLLNGDLGAGKTTFAKGFAKSLGVDANVKSPTFTIMKSYIGRLKLYHFDMYRIESEEELTELGFEEYFFDKDAVSLIEWNKVKDIIDKAKKITIEYISENSRRFIVE